MGKDDGIGSDVVLRWPILASSCLPGFVSGLAVGDPGLTKGVGDRVLGYVESHELASGLEKSLG